MCYVLGIYSYMRREEDSLRCAQTYLICTTLGRRLRRQLLHARRHDPLAPGLLRRLAAAERGLLTDGAGVAAPSQSQSSCGGYGPMAMEGAGGVKSQSRDNDELAAEQSRAKQAKQEPSFNPQ